MNIKEIKEMLQLMNENGLTEFEMEKDGLKIKLKKASSGSVEQTVTNESRAAQLIPAAQPAAQPEPVRPVTPRTLIKSPMVGTFYSAPAPDAPPFIQIGSQIEVGQVVCIIEAMKLMNEIKAEIRGKITEVLVNNGDPVEFGQPLFAVE